MARTKTKKTRAWDGDWIKINITPIPVAIRGPKYGIMSKAPTRIAIIPAIGSFSNNMPIKQIAPIDKHDKSFVSKNLENES